MGRVWRLRISLDKKYPGIIDSCRYAIDIVMPGQRASVEPQQKGCVVVSVYRKAATARLDEFIGPKC